MSTSTTASVNGTHVDIQNPTVRVRLFGGRSADEIAHDYPILAVDHPSLPVPGTSLAAQAIRMGDPPPTVEEGKKKKKTTYRPNGTWLTAVVRSILYQCDTALVVNDTTVMTQPGVFDDGHSRFGPRPCRLMVVGKCLGRTEVDEQRPFCGPGSSDLWTAWRESGMPGPGRELPTYMTNLLPFELPPSLIQQTIPKSLVQDGQHLLWHQFALTRPAVVLLLGADAVKAVLGRSATVAGYRGRVTSVTADFGTPERPDPWTASVVVADHPAAVARAPDTYPTFLGSINYLSRLLGFRRPPESVPIDYKSVYTLAELEESVRESERASIDGYVAFDCEWEGAHPSDPGSYLYTVQWSHAPGHARCAFLRRCGGARNEELLSPRATELFNRLFRRAPERGARLVAHFAKGDLKWLHAAGIDLYPVYVGPRDDNTNGANTYFEGAFDVYVAAHAVMETRVKQLEVMVAQDFGADRYDAPIDAWKTEYCKANKIRMSELKGYGNIPETTIQPYACKDADYAGREYLLHNGDPRKGTRGLLDKDQFGLSSRKIFGTRMRAWAAMAEMERYGLRINKDRHRQLSETVRSAHADLLTEIRNEIGWPEFAPSKRRHMVELLFGETYSPGGVKISPQNCLCHYMTPYKATKKSGGRLWEEARQRFEVDGGVEPEPAVDKETLINLSRESKLVGKFLDLSTLATALKGTFRPPDEPDAGDEDEDDEETEETYSKGLMHHVRGDGRIDTMLGLVETGRYSSSRPNLQNVTSSVDEKIDRILKWGTDGPNKDKKFVTRSVFEAEPGWFLADADLKGAEIAAAGWSSGDRLLIEHARRNNLDESDPDWLDLHSDLGSGAFNITCSYAEFKKNHKPLRVAAKRARFGHYYGASPETIHRQCLLDSPEVTLDQVRQIVIGHDKKYPTLANYFSGARRRVHKGWLRNGYGGTRRFRPAEARDLLAAQERAGQNWTCQGLVADHISEALGKLWYFFRDHGMRSRIVLAVHDSIVTESPPEEIECVATVLLPWAMGWGTPVVPTAVDGTPVVGRGPYYFGTSVQVCRVWGVGIADEEWKGHPDRLMM